LQEKAKNEAEEYEQYVFHECGAKIRLKKL